MRDGIRLDRTKPVPEIADVTDVTTGFQFDRLMSGRSELGGQPSTDEAIRSRDGDAQGLPET